MKIQDTFPVTKRNRCVFICFVFVFFNLAKKLHVFAVTPLSQKGIAQVAWWESTQLQTVVLCNHFQIGEGLQNIAV